jgi:hypothetical protein
MWHRLSAKAIPSLWDEILDIQSIKVNFVKKKLSNGFIFPKDAVVPSLSTSRPSRDNKLISVCIYPVTVLEVSFQIPAVRSYARIV